MEKGQKINIVFSNGTRRSGIIKGRRAKGFMVEYVKTTNIQDFITRSVRAITVKSIDYFPLSRLEEIRNGE